MRTNDAGIAVPSEERPTPWEFVDRRGSWQERDGLDIRQVFAECDDAAFALVAINYHERMADIVRQLAEWNDKPDFDAVEVMGLAEHAAALWAEYRKEVKP